jgi:hypothetical protein
MVAVEGSVATHLMQKLMVVMEEQVEGEVMAVEAETLEMEAVSI